MLHTNRVVHVDVICPCIICKRSCYVSKWISLREMKEVHTAIFLKFWLCFDTGIPLCHECLCMQRNLTESWVRSRLYKTGNVLNTLLIQYSNVGCFSANIIRVQLLCGEGGACSLNGVEYSYVQERKMHTVDSYSGVIKDSSCQGSDTERFMKFSQAQDDTFHLFMLPISLTIISTSTLSLYFICPQNKSL